MEAADQLGMFSDPEGELVCTCGHGHGLHARKGKGVCGYTDCICERFVGTGEVVPPPPRRTAESGSHAAIQQVKDPTKDHVAMLHVLSYCGPITDETLVRAYAEAVKKRAVIVQGIPFPKQSPSGIRLRRRELVDMSMVLEHDKVVGEAGGLVTRWAVNSKDKRVAKILAARARRGL
jgi:hypothetical protein